MKVILELNPENIPEGKWKHFPLREAARAIVYDQDENIALLKSNSGVYKIPGGGIDEGETPEEAVHRECREEAGCDIDIEKELGIIMEYKRDVVQKTYGYLAKVSGEKGKTNFDDKEKEWGFELIWVKPDEAIRLMESTFVSDYHTPFIKARELEYVHEAKRYHLVV